MNYVHHSHHRYIIGLSILVILALVEVISLILAIKIEWKTLGGAEAGIVASIITAAVTGTLGLAGSVSGHYFTSSAGDWKRTPPVDPVPPILPTEPAPTNEPLVETKERNYA